MTTSSPSLISRHGAFALLAVTETVTGEVRAAASGFVIDPNGGSVGIGVAIGSLPADAGRDAGVIVTGVTAGGPAEMAGIRPGDVLLAVNGTAVAGTLDLLRAVAAQPPGSRTSVTLNRNGARMALPITVGERPANAPE